MQAAHPSRIARQAPRPTALAAGLLLAVPLPALAAEAAACLEPLVDAEFDGEAYLAALRIETRKAGMGWTWSLAAPGEACDPQQPRLIFTGTELATLSVPGQPEQSIDLELVPGAERARSMAHTVAMATQPGVSTAPLVLMDDELTPVTPVTPAAREGLGAWLRAGGVYHRQPALERGVGGLNLEAGVALLDQRLAFSMAGSMAYGGETASSTMGLRVGPTQDTALLAMARGGVALGTSRLRLGVGAGWQRSALGTDGFMEDLEAALTGGYTRYDEINVDWMERDLTVFMGEASEELGEDERLAQDLWVAALELDLVRPLSDHWQLGLIGSARLGLGFEPFTLAGDPIHEPAPLAVGVQLALGYQL